MGKGLKPVLDEQGRKKCPQCKQAKKLTDFAPDDRKTFGRASWCHACTRELRKKRYDQGYALRDHRRRTYGVDDATYQAMFVAQNGACAICKRSVALAVDHCHKTKQVRALLCRACNTSLGYMEDDPARIKALLDYAEKWQNS